MKPIQWILSIIWFTALLAVLHTPRADFSILFGLYSLSFAAYILLVYRAPAIPVIYGVWLAILCRLVTLLFEPLLSDDFYRFIWDGMIMSEGFSPTEYVPSYFREFIASDSSVARLYRLLNSKDYYSVYPPIAQFIFYASYLINDLQLNGHILFFRTVLLTADLVIIFLLSCILKKKNLPGSRILIYALNPLVIVEFTGNLHMEGLMIAGLLAAVLFAEKRNWLLGGIAMSFSICSKMLSLMLVPLMPRNLSRTKLFYQALLSILISAGLFVLVFGSGTGWLKSLGLWFRSFEFNASLYYIAGEIYELFTGYENNKVVGPAMGLLTFILILLIWIIYHARRKAMDWSTAMMIALTIYFFLTTTLHPWYLGTLLAVSVVAGYRYPVAWTYLVFLSYSHYENNGFQEKWIYIIAEYMLLVLFMMYEFVTVKSLRKQKEADSVPEPASSLKIS